MSFRLLAACVALFSSAGCLSVSHRLEVRLRSADAVDLEAMPGSVEDGDGDGGERGVRVTGDDAAVRARGRALGIEQSGRDLVIGQVPLTSTGGAPLTIVRPLKGPIATVPTHAGRFRWRRDVTVPASAREAVVASGVPVQAGGRVTFQASTPDDNIARAELVTDWRQPLDIVPSLAAIAIGGVFALGFGAASFGIAEEALATSPPDQALLNESLGFGAGATVGLALVGYGIVSWILVDSDARTPVALTK